MLRFFMNHFVLWFNFRYFSSFGKIFNKNKLEKVQRKIVFEDKYSCEDNIFKNV